MRSAQKAAQGARARPTCAESRRHSGRAHVGQADTRRDTRIRRSAGASEAVVRPARGCDQIHQWTSGFPVEALLETEESRWLESREGPAGRSPSVRRPGGCQHSCPFGGKKVMICRWAGRYRAVRSSPKARRWGGEKQRVGVFRDQIPSRALGGCRQWSPYYALFILLSPVVTLPPVIQPRCLGVCSPFCRQGS